jgi:hypothetical protein
MVHRWPKAMAVWNRGYFFGYTSIKVPQTAPRT